jgi:hypothetical protein
MTTVVRALLSGGRVSTFHFFRVSLAKKWKVETRPLPFADAVLGGDLSGFKKSNYEDIETSVAPKVGQVEVYKVNHHCSQYSTNPTWLKIIQPKIGIISVGDGNGYGHPTKDCLNRL